MASKIDQGEVRISLDASELVLKPTVRAALTLSRLFDGLTNARLALGRTNLDSAITIIRIGANLSERDAKNLEERVFAEMGREPGATATMFVNLHRYVSILENGGRPLPDEVERAYAQGGQPEGN